MKLLMKGFFWLIWLIGWIVYIKTLSVSPTVTGLTGFAFGAVTLAEFFFELYAVREITAVRAPVYLYACAGFVFAVTLFTAFLLGGSPGVIGCTMRLLGFGLLLITI